MSGLVDLDELALRCRDDQARQYIAEAVACYKAGAFRSCIVACWIAVVFDFLGKLRELELSGDSNAIQHLKKFEAIRAGGEGRLADALKFERGVLELAEKEFELLTPLEHQDLARLQIDRNRCAHPSMQSLTDAYQPTAEMSRVHLRNAVEIMLAREPVQGKSALDRLFGEVKSDYFPKSEDDAVKHFAAGPLSRAKKSVIRDLVIGLTKTFLNPDTPPPERRRIRIALAAVLRMHRAAVEEVIRKDVPGIVSRVVDDRLWSIIALTYKLPVIWEALSDATRGRVRTYLTDHAENDAGLQAAVAAAMEMSDLRSIAVARGQGMAFGNFSEVVERCPDAAFCDRVAQEFVNVRGFRSAESYGRDLLLPLAKEMKSSHVNLILAAAKENFQIYGASGIQEVLCEFFDRTSSLHSQTKNEWQGLMMKLKSLIDGEAIGVTHEYADLRARMELAGMWPIRQEEAKAQDEEIKF